MKIYEICGEDADTIGSACTLTATIVTYSAGEEDGYAASDITGTLDSGQTITDMSFAYGTVSVSINDGEGYVSREGKMLRVVDIVLSSNSGEEARSTIYSDINNIYSNNSTWPTIGAFMQSYADSGERLSICIDENPTKRMLSVRMAYMKYGDVIFFNGLPGGGDVLYVYNMDGTEYDSVRTTGIGSVEIDDMEPAQYQLRVLVSSIDGASSCPSPGAEWLYQDTGDDATSYWYKNIDLTASSYFGGTEICHNYDCVKKKTSGKKRKKRTKDGK